MNFQQNSRLDPEEIVALAGTSQMRLESLPAHKPYFAKDQVAEHVWHFITAEAVGFDHHLPGWDDLPASAKELWLVAVEDILGRYWSGQPIGFREEAQRAFDFQNQVGGLFNHNWDQAPSALRHVYAGGVLYLTRLADFEQGDEPDIMQAREPCKEWVLERYTRG